MSTGEEDVYSRTARDITVSWGVCHFTKTLLDQVFNRNNVFWWRAGPHDGFAVALVAPETTGPDYKLSQEDERSSSSSCNLWLGQFDWHLERKPDAVGLYQPTFKTFFVVFSEEFQAIVEKKNLLQLFLMWPHVTVSGISLDHLRKRKVSLPASIFPSMSNGRIQSWIFYLSEWHERVPCHQHSRGFYYIWTVVCALRLRFSRAWQQRGARLHGPCHWFHLKHL